MFKFTSFTREFVKRITVMLILLTLWPGVAPRFLLPQTGIQRWMRFTIFIRIIRNCR